MQYTSRELNIKKDKLSAPQRPPRYISPSMENSSAVPAACRQAKQAHCRRFRIFKRRKRHNHQRRRQNNPDDPMKHDRVMSFQKPRDLFCQKHHRHACAQYRRNNRRQVNCSDVFHKRRIEPEAASKAQKTHPGAMMLSATQKPQNRFPKSPCGIETLIRRRKPQKISTVKTPPPAHTDPTCSSLFSCLPKTSTAAFRRSARQTGTPTKLHSVSGKNPDPRAESKNPPAAPRSTGSKSLPYCEKRLPGV